MLLFNILHNYIYCTSNKVLNCISSLSLCYGCLCLPGLIFTRKLHAFSNRTCYIRNVAFTLYLSIPLKLLLAADRTCMEWCNQVTHKQMKRYNCSWWWWRILSILLDLPHHFSLVTFCGLTESFRLENTFRISKSNYYPNLLSPVTNPCLLVSRP